jgi:hypothetical protein
MSYMVQQLFFDILQRAGRLDNPAGITLLGAANSIQSMLVKKLADRRSDLLATNDLGGLQIPPYGNSVALPTGFIAMAEKPKVQDVYTDWMMGSVVSYNNVTGALTVAVENGNGTDTLSDWNIATVPAPGPGNQAAIIGSATDTITVVSSGNVSFTTTPAGMNLSPGAMLYILSQNLPPNYQSRHRTMQPYYLNDEPEEHDLEWWNWYGLYGWGMYGEQPCIHPRYFRVIGTTLYVRPKPILEILIVGKYFGLPANLTEQSVIPFNGLFDEIFRAGIIRIIAKGLEIPDSDPDFMAFLAREFDGVIGVRMHILPQTRTKRSNFM